jgi:hypothetical protein
MTSRIATTRPPFAASIWTRECASKPSERQTWQSLQLNLPDTQVADLKVDSIDQACHRHLIRLRNQVEQGVHFLIEECDACLPDVRVFFTFIGPCENPFDFLHNNV